MTIDETEYRPDRTPLVRPGEMDLHARDMTATFSADVTLAEAQRQLAELGQWLPVDGEASWMLGRLVEHNSSGPLRLGYGAWRDLLLGCQFHNGRGDLITAGGRTVKNVAGYDLTKFMVGQGGVLGRLVTITARTHLRPAGAILARFPADVWQINRLLPTPCRPQWAALTREGTWCGYLGDQRTLDYYRTALVAHAPAAMIERSLEDDVRHRSQLWRAAGGADGSFRASVPPIKILEFARGAALDDWSADAAFGVVVGFTTPPRWDAIRSAAHALRGSVHFVEGGRTRVQLEADRRALLLRLKDAFDPDGKLEPFPEP